MKIQSLLLCLLAAPALYAQSLALEEIRALLRERNGNKM